MAPLAPLDPINCAIKVRAEITWTRSRMQEIATLICDKLLHPSPHYFCV